MAAAKTAPETPLTPDFAAHTANINTLVDALLAEGLTDKGVRYAVDIKNAVAQFDPAYVAPEFPEPISE
jgi:hypothetical protein